MKQIKFKQLATFSLCCSLLVNSLTGVTAVAETMTIESSPTAESSVKEETVKASTEESVKASTEESMKESTEKSTKESVEGSTVKSTAESTQKSEETEQEEITKETTEERKQTEESSIVSPKQIQPVISNEDYYTAIQTELTNFVGRAQIYQDFFSTLPEGRIAFDITTADAPTLNMTDFNLSADLKSLTRPEYLSNLVNITSSKLSIAKTQNSLAIVVPEQTSLLPTSPARAYMNYLDNIHLTVPKYVQSASISGSVVSLVVNGGVGSANGPIVNSRSQVVLSKLTASSFKIHTDNDVLTNSYDATNTKVGTVPGAFLWEVKRDGNATLANTVFMPKQASVITVALKKVTENFKDVNGTAIPAPTGFAQGKKTSITSNDYTFTQSGTLPKSYKGTDGKTYVLKGWYKGKTKPDTLSTGTPTYKVTYDDDDDLNVVYEEVNFPEETYQFGFVDEAGKLVNPADINITYDYKNIAFRGTGGAGSTVSFDTIATNQSAATVGNLKNVTMPATSIARPTETGWNGEAYSNLSIKLPRYFQSLNLYDKTGKINPSYPLPVITNSYSNITNEVQDEASVINSLTVTQRPDQSYTPKEIYSVVNPSVKYPEFLRRIINSNDIASGRATYLTLSSPVYYHLTNRKVTENFVDASGAKLPSAPTGFTQGKQTVIDSDPYTFTQSGTLPKSYKGTDGKTYVLKGWYKGKTKPDTLRTDAPSYKVTYDGNDDLNVVYEEAVEKTTTIPAVTYKFGFVNEKGVLVSPSLFIIKTNLTTVINATPKQVGTATGVNNGNLQHLTIPSQTLTYTAEVNPAFSGATDLSLETPKYYKMPTVTPGTHYKGSTTAYPIATTKLKFVSSTTEDEIQKDGQLYSLQKTNVANSYRMYRNFWESDTTHTLFAQALNMSTTKHHPSYYTTDDTMYYFLENRRVTENFVDATGAKITPPTGFTQGKQTVIDSSPYTFKQSGTLPDSYKVGTKTYKFKGWYKGTDKTKIQTTKAPSYAVTFDDKDDLNVVYEVDTTKDYNFPSKTVNFQFVNEAGTIISPTPFTITTDLQQEINSTYTKLGSITGANSGNTKQVTIPAKTIRADVSLGGVNNYGTTNTRITIPKFYENISVYTGSAYTQATLNRYSIVDNTLIDNPASNAPVYYGLSKMTATQFKVDEFDSTSAAMPERSKYLYNRLYLSGAPNLFNSYYIPVGTIYYQLTNRKVTENFVDSTGTKITPPTGFTQGKQTVIDSDSYTFKQSGTLPKSYKGTDGKTYVLKGWYKGKTKPSTLRTDAPSYPVTFDGDDDLNVVYEEGTASVAASLKGMVTVMPSGGNQMWNMTIKNTGTAPLTNLKITPTANWSKGLANPKQLSVRLGSGPNQLVSVTAESWANGANLGVEVPVGGTLTVSMTTLATGNPMEVLQAEVALSGNMPTTTVSDTVRIEGADQEVTDPVGEGFISLPTFDFGQVGVAGATTQHGLKKAADYYGNGTRNPFVRIKKSQPNWSLTAQLSQPKSAKDSLPTATRLLLGQAAVSKVDNYNLVTEMLNPVGTTPTLSLTANNSVTNVITNKQFTGNDVYHLDFNFNNVKLEVPANQGTKGEQYNATVTWNLVTGP